MKALYFQFHQITSYQLFKEKVIFCLILLGLSATTSAQITEIIDATGDGGGNVLDNIIGLARDASDNIFVVGSSSDNVFKITPGGVITEIIDATGDGTNTLDAPRHVAIDGSGNAYVVGSGATSDNAFKITPGGVITEIIDATGDGGGNMLDVPRGVAVDGSENVYVVGSNSDNAFKITPGGVITEIIDATGDGSGNTMDNSRKIAVDGSGNVFVSAANTDNVFKITPGGVITEIIDATGDGAGNTLDFAHQLAVDDAGNVYVAGSTTDNVFKITPGGVITEIIDATGDGAGNPLDNPRGLTVTGDGTVLVAGANSDNAFKITPGGVITEIIDATGDGGGNILDNPRSVVLDGLGNAYVGGSASDNVFRISNVILPVELSSFRAEQKNQHINLTWLTNTELNNESFEIQRSRDGIEFNRIGEIKGSGTTYEQQEYIFIDENPGAAMNYYRLKQKDLDGQFEYSKIVVINFRSSGDQIGAFYPNPSPSAEVNLNYYSKENKEISLSFYDLAGNLVLARTIALSEGMNYLNFDFSTFEQHFYIAMFDDGAKKAYRKFMIQK